MRHLYRLTKAPKCAGEPYFCQKCLRLFKGVPSPFRLELLLIPTIGKPPSLIRSEFRSACQAVCGAPTIDMLFCPEEKHCASSEADIIPPTMSRDREVNQALILQEFAATDL